MRVIGFNFTKISAEKFENKKPLSISADIKFISVEKEEIFMLKEEEALKVSFSFIVNYPTQEIKESKEKKDKDLKENNAGEVSIQGFITISASKDESKEILKSWKKKELPESFRNPLLNFILKKCTVKALELEDQLGLPSHLPFPQIKPQKTE